MLELIKLNHYEVDDIQINNFIKKINNIYDLNIENIAQVTTIDIDPYDERLIPITRFG